jgi:hypothetical protein
MHIDNTDYVEGRGRHRSLESFVGGDDLHKMLVNYCIFLSQKYDHFHGF